MNIKIYNLFVKYWQIYVNDGIIILLKIDMEKQRQGHGK